VIEALHNQQSQATEQNFLSRETLILKQWYRSTVQLVYGDIAMDAGASKANMFCAYRYLCKHLMLERYICTF